MINHIAFIMDGNRRYAKKANIDNKKAYEIGMLQFLSFIEYQIKYNIKETSFFALSTDNIEKRPIEEKNIIFELIQKFYKNKEIKNLFEKNCIQINLIGNIKELEEKNKKNKNFNFIQTLKQEFKEMNNKLKKISFIVNIAINYDGQKDIVESTKEICKKILNKQINLEEINEKLIRNNLSTNQTSIPEIIVRPGNAPRLSGFYLWDSKYSEIYFTPKFWPELEEKDFKEILIWYNQIQRNFGK